VEDNCASLAPEGITHPTGQSKKKNENFKKKNISIQGGGGLNDSGCPLLVRLLRTKKQRREEELGKVNVSEYSDTKGVEQGRGTKK